MNRITLLFLMCLPVSLHGSENTLYEEVIYNQPTVGEDAEVYLGDRMLTQQVGSWKECITPRTTYAETTWGWTYTYKGGEPACKRELADKYYWPTYVNAAGHGNEMKQPIRWSGKKGKYKLCQMSMGMAGACIKNLSEDDVDSGETFIYRENSFQQTIEYTGRSGDILTFTYSEFTGGYARQAFTREFQVDLTEGNVAAFKGSIVEILEATNIKINYRVIRNFASDR